jgi:RNA polymerase sigma-70 factor (ECF subfamily)
MPSQRRAIFQMHREYGLKYNEIADKLGISASTARNSVAAALETIRQKLAKMGLAIFFALFFALQ